MKEKLKKMTIAELQKRQGELQAIGQNPENRTAEELEQLAEERQAIDEELNELRNQANLEVLRRAAVANGTVPVTVLQKRDNGQEAQKRTFAVDSVEYRDAYLKNLMGKPLDAEERAALTSANAVIPTEMQNKIWDKLRENPLIAEIDMLHVPGYVVLPKATTVNDANWVAMGTAATDSADVVGSVSLGAKKLIKTIEIEADIKAMSIPAFQTWLVNKLVEKMETAICAAVINGAGSATVPQGVMAAAAGATAKTVAFTVAGLGEAMGALPSAYHRNAVWVMSAATFYGTIMPLATDSNGLLVMNGIEQRLLGHKVVLDENVAAKIIFGDFHNGYAFNFGDDIRVESDTSVEFRKGSTVYRAMALADGAVVQGEAFVVATKSA